MARIGVIDAKNTVRANATAILILRFCMFSYLLRILAALLFLTVSAWNDFSVNRALFLNGSWV